MAPDDAVGTLLRAAACVDRDAGALEALRRACGAQTDWDKAIREAEQHGVAPWLEERVTAAGADIPQAAHRKLKLLAHRHAMANDIRARALAEILRQYEARGIEVLVLKGAALAHIVYERPGLRPMCDIDLLVAPGQLTPALQTLEALDYRESETQELLRGHHHLPTQCRTFEGLRVSIEIHHDAIAPDNIGSIRLDTLSGPPRPFRFDDTPARALGHVDMLRHLCRHALQPRETIKIGSVLDILLYAARYGEEIDWPRLRRDFPEVMTSLALFGHLLRWPAALEMYLHAPAPPAPAGVGVGMLPLSELRRRPDRLARLLNPSDWWLRAFYNVAPGRSLAATKTIRHPARLAYWLWRRLGKAAS